MDGQAGATAPLPPAQTNQTPESPFTITAGVSEATAFTKPNGTLSSAPPTPAAQRAVIHPLTSPLPHHQDSPASSSAIRRTTSATGLNDHRSSSPHLARKSSRTSLGASQQAEDADNRRPTPKRSISNLISGLREAQARMEAIEEPVPLTAAQIAAAHFTRELAAHYSPSEAGSEGEVVEAETVVILHDACYGHRYSRPKTSRASLSMIVERPERIHASVLGASAAYVRLGGHHAGARNAPFTPSSSTAGAPPPFKIRRTSRSMDVTSSFVTNVHGTAWMSELRTLCNAAGNKLAAGVKELSRASTPTEPEKRKLHEGDLYLCSESLNAFQGALGGVAEAVDTVFAPSSRTKRAFVAIRPPGHHCSADYPSGFCWLNNVHVGIEYAAQTHGLTHAVILDFDLHHGDGSQAITWQRNSSNNTKRLSAKPNSKLKLAPDIGYYSLHDINSYPCEMGDDEKVQAASLCIDNAHGQSIWNVHLQPWKTEKEFWDLYNAKYCVLLEKARAFLQHHTARLRAEGKVEPRAAVFISAGFDASEWEGAGMQRHKVNVPTEFYARFTRDASTLAQEQGTGCEGRVISVLEGGYSDRALCSGVLSHLSGLCATPIEGLKTETSAMDGLDQMMRGLGINGTGAAAASSDTFYYNKAWWSPANLTALEMKVNPPLLPQAKKTRVGQQPTYATPTESFAYKVVDADKFARSISGTMREVVQPARPPTPPPPEVDWVLATQELSNLLIPTDRQTKSCTAEELAAPSRAKKDHAGIMAQQPPAGGVAEEPSKPRQLRDRKSKAPAPAENAGTAELESARSASRTSRRQTIAELPSASASAQTSAPASQYQRQRASSRRLSAGSALSSVAGDLDPPPVPSIPRTSSAPRSASGTHPPVPTTAAQGQGVHVKKTRAPAIKKDAGSSAPSSPKRSSKPPAGRLPTQANAPPPTPPPPPQSSAGSNDLEALTAGMKKVTLKVGSREEHDRRQKERVDGERRARALKAAETRRVNAAARKAAKESEGGGGGGAGGGAILPAEVKGEIGAKENTAPALAPAQSVFFASNVVGDVGLGLGEGRDQAGADAGPVAVEPKDQDDSTAAPPGAAIVQPVTMASSDIAGYGTIQNHGAAQSVPVALPSWHEEQNNPTTNPISQDPMIASAVPQQNAEVSHPGPANGVPAASPANIVSNPPPQPPLPQPTRSPNGPELPVFSSTGFIPFAPAGMANGNPPSGLGTVAADAGARHHYHDATLKHADDSEAAALKTEEKEQGASIWDVPATPHK